MSAADKYAVTNEEDEPLLPVSSDKAAKPLTLRQQVYLYLEEPLSSTTAMVVTGFIFTCIALSVAAFVVESLPSMEQYHQMWFMLETFFVGVFTIEYIVRLWATVPEHKTLCQFIIDPFNVIDVLAIAPYYISLMLQFSTGEPHAGSLRFLRSLRLLRLLKLARYSQQAKIIAIALSRSGASLVMLACLLGCALTLFSTLIFLVERGTWDKDQGCYIRKEDGLCSPYQSIPESSWWVITSMTTVGYGDTFPKTNVGRVVAAFCMVGGILSVALPTTVLGVQFSDAYDAVTEEMASQAIRNTLPKGGLRDELGRTLANLEVFDAQMKKLFPELNASLLAVTEKHPIKRAAIDVGWAPLADANMNALQSVRQYLESIHEATKRPGQQ